MPACGNVWAGGAGCCDPCAKYTAGDELLAVSVFERLDDPPATIGDPEDLLESFNPRLSSSDSSSSQISWFSVAPPRSPEGAFSLHGHAKRDHKRLTAAVDRVEVHREERKNFEPALLELLQLLRCRLDQVARHRARRHTERPCLRSSPFLRTCEQTSLEALALGVPRKAPRLLSCSYVRSPTSPSGPRNRGCSTASF